jgi:chromate transporter
LSAITAAVVGVILNLAIWFAVHTLFRSVAPIEAGPLRFDAPVFASLDPWALLLSTAAIVAVLRFKTGTLPTLAATSLAGVGLYLSGVIA